MFAVGLVLLLIFTFTDLQISMAIANKPGWARIFEVVGEIPFTALTVAACALLFRFRTRKNKLLSILAAIGSGLLFVLFAFMGGFNNIYASFPSGHSMNSAGVILLMLLPPMIPALQGKEKALHATVYVWCIVVGISRVFMGAHFASDVTVGVLLSLAIFEALRSIGFGLNYGGVISDERTRHYQKGE